MCGRREINAYVEDMVVAGEQVILFTQGLSDEQILDPDTPVRGAVLHLLTVLDEAAKHVPDPVQQRYCEIPWQDIAGLRDKIVHYYFGLRDQTIALTVKSAVPSVLPQLGGLLAELDAGRER